MNYHVETPLFRYLVNKDMKHIISSRKEHPDGHCFIHRDSRGEELR